MKRSIAVLVLAAVLVSMASPAKAGTSSWYDFMKTVGITWVYGAGHVLPKAWFDEDGEVKNKSQWRGIGMRSAPKPVGQPDAPPPGVSDVN